MAAEYSEEEEEEILHIDDLQAVLPGNAGLLADMEMAKPSEILASTTDSEAWNLEVERVAPKLKVTVRVDGRDWRSHLEQVSHICHIFSHNCHNHQFLIFRCIHIDKVSKKL